MFNETIRDFVNVLDNVFGVKLMVYVVTKHHQELKNYIFLHRYMYGCSLINTKENLGDLILPRGYSKDNQMYIVESFMDSRSE